MADSAYVWCKGISIHALRKESDQVAVDFHAEREISIHALRKESDNAPTEAPPTASTFQSTLSVRRATIPKLRGREHWHISIHALRKESDGRLT